MYQLNARYYSSDKIINAAHLAHFCVFFNLIHEVKLILTISGHPFSISAFLGSPFSYTGNLVPHFPVVSVGIDLFAWSLISPSFSGPAFSIYPMS